MTASAVAEARTTSQVGGGVAAAISIALILIFSQAWVFPLLGEKGDPSASGLVRVLYVPAYVGTLVLLLMAPWRTLSGVIRQPFLILLMVIVGLSTYWSVAPDQTLRRVVALYATTLGGVVLGVRYRWAELAEILATAFAILAVMSVVVALAIPQIGVMHELFPGAWRGPWVEKNQLGGIMGLGFCIFGAAALLNPRRATLWWIFAAVAVGLILMSTSKTSLVAMLVGAGALLFVVLARRGPAIGVAVTWLGVIGLMMIAGVALFASDVLLDLLGKDATLTGRTKIWEAIMRRIAERPWTGYGYGAVWTEKGAWGPLAWIIKDSGFKPEHAHNSWLEQWLGLGLGGLVLFVLLYLQTLVTAVVAIYREKGAYLAIPFLVVYSLVSVTESVAVTYNDFRWVIFTALAVKLAWPDERAIA